MRHILAVILVFAAATASQAGVVEGRITVMDKSGRAPLTTFTDSVVYLDRGPGITAETAVMDQMNKIFMPRLLVAVSGQTVRFINSDTIQHNIFSPHPEEPFDLGRFGRGEERSITLKVLGPHAIYCNIHQQMVADVYVVPNRHFAVTDAQGRFRIDDVPPGTYTLKAWHVLGGADEQVLEVKANNATVEMTLQARKHVREITQHKNKDGQDYPRTDQQNYEY